MILGTKTIGDKNLKKNKNHTIINSQKGHDFYTVVFLL
jgi:hypothetical protein